MNTKIKSKIFIFLFLSGSLLFSFNYTFAHTYTTSPSTNPQCGERDGHNHKVEKIESFGRDRFVATCIDGSSAQAPKTGQVTQIICAQGGTALYDNEGKPKGCIVPPLQTNRNPAGNVIGAICPTGSQAYYKSPSGALDFIRGAEAEFIGCLDPRKITEVKREQLNVPGSSAITQKVTAYTTQINIPCQPIAGGQCSTIETPAGYIARIYQFGLMIVGLLAFGAIVVGSVEYILSAGSVANQQDATDRITQAILGLVLLLGAYLILYTINPGLVNLRNPQLEVIRIQDLAPPPEISGEFRRVGDQYGSLGSGSTGESNLCKVSSNWKISVNSKEVGTNACIECVPFAYIPAGSNQCKCADFYVPYENQCITTKAYCDARYGNLVGILDLYDEEELICFPPTEDLNITDEQTCNSTTNRIWANGKCYVGELGF